MTMQVEEELARVSPEKDTVLTIGVFDGVHLGHKYLLSELKEHARKQGMLSGVVTFHQHPLTLLASKTKLPYLTDPVTRTGLLKNEGVDAILTLSFTPELAQLGAPEFVSLLKKYLRMCGLFVGPDFALGRNREGNIDTLRKLGQEMDFTVTVIPPIMINGEVVSSTAIRKALAQGNMEKVHTLTGRPFSLHGQVILGTGRGLKLGFPTANLDIDPQQAVPADGVYVSRAYLDDKTYKAMTNIGTNPTFGDTEHAVEVYLLDYNNNLYGRELRINIVKRIRDEKRFDTIEQLEEQIAEDVKQGRAILDS
jgi:riboflavin kinase/FMN adenylyltransferase